MDSLRAVANDLVSTVAAQTAKSSITENDHNTVYAHSIATRISELTTKLAKKLMLPEVTHMRNPDLSSHMHMRHKRDVDKPSLSCSIYQV